MKCCQVVELVKEKNKKLTLAIGDGANDVTMIRKADVGVGKLSSLFYADSAVKVVTIIHSTI